MTKSKYPRKRQQVAKLIAEITNLNKGLISATAASVINAGYTDQINYLDEIKDQIRSLPQRMEAILGKELTDKIKNL